MPAHTGIAGGCFTETPLPAPSLTVSNDGRCAWLRPPVSRARAAGVAEPPPAAPASARRGRRWPWLASRSPRRRRARTCRAR
jgi:hypothetical protein